MNGKISKRYFIGKSKPGEWASVYTYKPQSPDIRRKRGEIFASISLSGPKDFSLSTAGNLLLDNLHENYFENREDKTSICLEKAIIATSKFLEKLLENDKVADIGIDLDLIVYVVIEDIIYIASIGQGLFYIYRDNELIELAESLRDPTGEGHVKVGSFVAKKNDIYLLASPGVKKETLKADLLEATRTFSENPFKNKLYEHESKIAVIMTGYSIDKEWLEQSIAGGAVSGLKQRDEDSEMEIEREADADKESLTEDIKEGIGVEEELDFSEESFEEKYVKGDFEQSVLEDEGKDLDDEMKELDRKPKGPVDEDFDPDYVAGSGLEVHKPGKFAGTKGFVLKAKNFFLRAFRYVKRSVKVLLQKIKQKFAKKPDPGFAQGSSSVPVQGTEANVAGVSIPSESKSKQTRVGKAHMKTYQYYLIKVKSGLMRFFKGVKALVWDNWLGMGGNEVYLRGRGKKRRWGFLFIIIVIVIGVLYFSIQNQIQEQERKAKAEAAQGHINAAIKIIDEVKEEADVLASLYGNDERKQASLDKLTGAEAELDEASKENLSELEGQIKEQKDRMQVIRDQYNRIIIADDADRVVDLAGIFPNSNPVDITIFGNELYILDQKGGKIYKSDYSGAGLKEIASGFSNPRSITVDKDGNLIVLDDNSDACIAIVDKDTGTVKRPAGLSASRLQNVKQIIYVSNDKTERVYGVDTTEGKMLYLDKSASSYSLPQYKPEQYEEFKKSTDIMVMWPKVYLLAPMKQGVYVSYGDKDDTKPILGLLEDENLYSATALYIDGNYTYIGDPQGKRVLVFLRSDNDFKLKAQYLAKSSKNFENIKEVIADYSSRKIFVLDGTKILVLDLNKLNLY